MASPAKLNKAIDKLIVFTETAAGIFLAAVTLFVFVNVTVRGASTGLSDVVNWFQGNESFRFVLTIPEWYHLSCLALGVCIFWGLAATSYRNDHIKVDILWDWASPANKRLIDIFATARHPVPVSWLVFSHTCSAFKVHERVHASGEATYDLRLLSSGRSIS
jgi:TRAP-type mannitol/chloroaromatic compound transport system permease small subunit